MSFGSLMTAYLKWMGMAEAELSVYRGSVGGWGPGRRHPMQPPRAWL